MLWSIPALLKNERIHRNCEIDQKVFFIKIQLQPACDNSIAHVTGCVYKYSREGWRSVGSRANASADRTKTFHSYT